jgi:hypothetical protein
MRLYHFLSAQNALSDLALCRLRVSRYHALNDLFELMAANMGTHKGVREVMLKHRAAMDREQGLICFTRGYSEPMLWSHYADKHRGICLGFDVDDDSCTPVEYVKERIPVVNATGVPDAELLSRTLWAKGDSWKYEDEVRVHILLKNVPMVEDGVYFVPFTDGMALREVILGAVCPIPAGAIYKLCSRIHGEVHVLKAALAFKSFTVVANPHESDT